MGESDKDSGEKSPDRPIPEDEDIEERERDTTNKPKLVGYEPTNPLNNYKVFEQLILCKQTNIILKELRESHPVIVCRWETIVRGEKALEVVSLMCEKQVFAIPTIIHNFSEPFKQAKPYVYEIVKALEIEGLLVRTPYKAVKPDPSETGPKPFFYMWSHLDLNAWNDPRLKNAQKDYNEVMAGVAKGRTSVKQSADNLLITISREVTDYYRQRGEFGRERSPSHRMIVSHLRANYIDISSPQIRELADKISQTLYEDGKPALKQKEDI